MKKVLALVLVAIMLTVAASAATFVTTEVPVSFDTIFFDEQTMKDGSAGLWIDDNPITVGAVKVISTRGWCAPAAPIEAYGYKINEAAVVYDTSFTIAPEDGLDAATGGTGNVTRFKVNIPVEGLTAASRLATYVKLTDGTEYKIIEFDVNGEYVAPVEPSVPTADAAVVVIAAVAAIALAGVVVVKKVRA